MKFSTIYISIGNYSKALLQPYMCVTLSFIQLYTNKAVQSCPFPVDLTFKITEEKNVRKTLCVLS